ncbi:ferredoxin reductase [Nakamurella lactea]|uniref:ferredoxin reductase n=1 Tax=Nakamurella lactea TaxID=459515 RepID=UPI000425EFBE|nr:ferredoxin reductase [Nakamurella lactea]
MAGTAISGRLTGRLVWQRATLLAVTEETAGARSLAFEVPGWPGHLGGQHVDLRLTADDGYTAQRSYSMSAPAGGDLVTITVQRVDDGEVSPYLVDQLRIGDAVELRGPVGGWFVWRPTDPAPVLLVGGGSGVVPLMAMIRARRAAGSRVPFRLIYSVRTPADVLFARELRQPPIADGGLDTAWVYTREAPAGAAGLPHRITLSDLTAHGWPADLEPMCFVCGPTGFVEAVATALVDLGHPADRVKTERFGPSGS